MSTAATPDHCANCEAPLGGHYCSNCGQEAVLHHASTREFLHEFIGHYVALEGKLWGSLKRLILKPGELTNEYMRGRRVRYVQPLRLYLTFSVLFFALLKLGAGASHQEAPQEAKPSIAQVAAAAREQDETPAAGGHSVDEAYIDGQLSEWPLLRRQWHALNQLSQEQQIKVFQNAVYHYVPYAIFCLMPVFALFLKVLYLGSGRRFGEHMLFALHTNAFAFLMFSVLLLVPYAWARFVLWVWLLGYLPWAMRRVYHRSRLGTFGRWLLLMAAYMVSLGLAIMCSAAAGFFTIGH